MLELGIPAVVGLLQSLIPMLSTTSVPSILVNAVSVLTEYAPVVFQEYKALKPVVLDAIEAIHNNTNTPADEIMKLRALVKVDDDEFDEALAKSRAED